MKKTLISFVLILAVLMLPMQFAFAAIGATYTATYNEATDGIIVSGTLTTNRGNIPLTLVVAKNDGTFVEGYQTIAVRNAEGKIAFTFDEVKLPYSATTGVYRFTVTGDGVVPTDIATYSYLSVEDTRLFIADVNTKIAAGGAGIYDKILSGVSELGIDRAALTALDANAQSVFNTQMLSESYVIPSSSSTDAEVLQVKNAYKKLIENSKNALAIASFANINNSTTLNAWFGKQYNALGFNVNDPATAEDETVITNYVNNVKSSNSFINRIANYNAPASIKAVQNHIYESALLTAIETMHFSNTYGIIAAFPTLFTVNTANLSKVADEKKGDVYASVANTYYANYAALIADFDAKVLAIISESGSTTIPGGWGGGGSGSSGGTVFVPGNTGTDNNPVEPTQPDQKPDEKFSDISNVSWAKEAIISLSEKGIINGKSEGVFAPNDLITRAEFIKLLVAATNTKLAEGERSSFTDVSADAWYSPYLAAAEKSDLILGNEQNKFMPESFITRQDMAVILHRAFKTEGEGTKISFTDEESIADYAKDAITALTTAGVIKGTGNGMFEPMSNAIRAQAAVMIYNILK